MILFAEERHKEQIAVLWNEAFGDSCKDVLKYLEVLLKYFVVFEEEGRVYGMLALLPVRLGEKKGRYVYAVATLKEARGRGISTELLNFAKKFIKQASEDFLVLVPQSESLFDFYKKRGFKAFSCVGTGEAFFNEIEDVKIYISEITPEKYYSIRRKYFANLIEWDSDMLAFVKDMYNGTFYRLKKDDIEIGSAFCFSAGDTVYVKELCTDSENIALSVAALANRYQKMCVKYNFADFSEKPYAMIYPETIENAYFGIAMD